MQSRLTMFIFSLVVCSQELLGAAWNKSEEASYFKVWDRLYFGNSAFTLAGEGAYEVGAYHDNQLNFYYEYGLDKNLTLVVMGAPLGYAASGGNSSTYVGPFSLGARVPLFATGRFVSALEASLAHSPAIGSKDIISTQYEDSEGEKRNLYYRPAEEFSRMEMQLQIGYGFNSGWSTFTLGAQRFSDEEFDGVIRGGVQLGFHGEGNWRHSYDLSFHRSQGKIQDINLSGAGQTNYYGFNVGLAYRLSPTTAYTFDWGGAPFAEANAYSPSLSFGYEMTSD